MARIEWVKQRLINWALWKAREAGGGLGFPGQSSFLRESSGGYREAIIPVDDCDAALTNDAVESFKVTRPHIYDALQCIYVKTMTVREAARELGKAESTVKALLDVADHALATWFIDRHAKKQKSFTS